MPEIIQVIQAMRLGACPIIHVQVMRLGACPIMHVQVMLNASRRGEAVGIYMSHHACTCTCTGHASRRGEAVGTCPIIHVHVHVQVMLLGGERRWL